MIPDLLRNDVAMSVATTYANKLLDTLGRPTQGIVPLRDEHPARTWRECGMMSLTGEASQAGLMCPAPIAACADGVTLALESLGGNALPWDWRGAQLLTERAHIMGLAGNGRTAPGGSCRLLDCADGTLAVNLARDEDWSLLPAWLESEMIGDWETLATTLKKHQVHPLIERARLMGLAISADRPVRSQPVPWFSEIVKAQRHSEIANRAPRAVPRVLDLSSLWAGPLCSRLLQAMGAEVIKVESSQRPDGARRGSTAFFERLNNGKQITTLDWQSAAGSASLHRLIQQADIVIEASRPRALKQLGIDAEALVNDRAGLTWISINGYGRSAPQADWVAFGDDAGVAAGLSSLMHTATGERLFVGDAVADPLTGMHAALAAWSAYQNGGGRLLSLPMRDVVTHCIQHDLPESDHAIQVRQRAWTQLANNHKEAA